MLSAESLLDSSSHRSVHTPAGCQGCWIGGKHQVSPKISAQTAVVKLQEKDLTWEAEKVKTAEEMRSQAASEIEGLLFLISLSTECFFPHRVAIVSGFCASLAAGYQDVFINPDDFMMCTGLAWFCTLYAITPYVLNQL